MENYYTVSQKSDCGRLQEVLGLGFTRGPKGFLCKYLYYYYCCYYYLFIYLFYFIFLTVDLSPGHDIQILVRSCFELRSWFYQVQVRSQFLIIKVRLSFLFFTVGRNILRLCDSFFSR